jgi:hypothetical protein
MREGHKDDLRISFGRPLAIKWEDERFDFAGSPEELPKCETSDSEGYNLSNLDY